MASISMGTNLLLDHFCMVCVVGSLRNNLRLVGYVNGASFPLLSLNNWDFARYFTE